jgi:hypothetical protein
VEAAVSCAPPGKEGNLYRFDGWQFYGYCKPWADSGEQSWSNLSKANEMDDGIKRLYYYQYPTVSRDIAALLAGAGFDCGRKRKKGGAPGFIVTSPAPGAIRVRYLSVGRASAIRTDEMLVGYAAAIKAAGYAVTATYVTRENLRAAVTTVVNATLEARDPHLVGRGDEHRVGLQAVRVLGLRPDDRVPRPLWRLWRDDLWHVERCRLCVYSQLKSCSSSEVAAMIEGLLRHGTDAGIEANYTDTHGASLVGSRSPSCSASSSCPG